MQACTRLLKGEISAWSAGCCPNGKLLPERAGERSETNRKALPRIPSKTAQKTHFTGYFTRGVVLVVSAKKKKKKKKKKKTLR
eukprot:NODE_1564_length_436_cov_138.226537_g1554_i0.p1 GENE.NODE_1564_length_436_cov_138.226537_g1554_i0~~NODE_1564_length_436_cov_138.226537_g1554_i0.p1  ORF type:complete len:83 (-),score=35.40 NODE_1564_length_436_cov_138.226537_g1554_i0:5-253(-)